ncbi:MAG: DUF4401 domain-containing protein [Elusimicrobium sp.]|jgi:hypothetical protein|nr:DUF4401 domain-containing protein [Elusimicrobium sp.]
MTDGQMLSYVPEDKKTAARAILQSGKNGDMPVIIKIILGAGAFASSILFFSALGAFSYMLLDGEAYIAVGVISMAAAILLKKFALPRLGPMLGFFFDQCLLVAMLFGRVCIFAGAENMRLEIDGFLILSFFMAVIPYKFFDNFIDRFIAVFVFAVCVYVKYFFMMPRWHRVQNIDFAPVILFFFMGAGIIFAARKKLFNPAAWALITSALIPSIFVVFFASAGWFDGVDAKLQSSYLDVVFNWQKMVLVIYFGLMFLAYKKFTAKIKHDDYLVFAVLIFALLPFNLPVLYGLFFLLLGKFFEDLSIEILGYATLAGGIVYLYYSLQVSLMTKSLLLMASGLFLFGLRLAVRRFYAR